MRVERFALLQEFGRTLDGQLSPRLLGAVSDENRTRTRRFHVFALFGLLVLLASAGCTQKSGETVVLGKDHVPETEISVSPAESASPPSAATPVTRPERWIVNLEMVADSKKVDVQVNRKKWDALQAGDRVQVVYREGKYTGTVWASEIK